VFSESSELAPAKAGGENFFIFSAKILPAPTLYVVGLKGEIQGIEETK
jgi:hypothetical protein